jgi:hypothetical protein
VHYILLQLIDITWHLQFLSPVLFDVPAEIGSHHIPIKDLFHTQRPSFHAIFPEKMVINNII